MSMRVFIIDDDRDHAESIADVLTMRGFECELAFSGEAGLTRFREADFDIVFMDVKLPGMNGVETFFEFRKLKPDVKVMLMTGFSLEQLVAQAVENGALGVLRKPFEIKDLLDVLENVKPRGMVLVADDDPEFSASLEPILRQHGYSVQIVSSGREALEMASQEGVNCLILDLKMPMLSGLEVYVKLKELGRTVPTIFITGFPGERNLAMARLNQTIDQDVLMKPFDPNHLLAAIDALVAGGNARRRVA
ncbi:MAG TPA: response regulator [Stellaceae bacterium]|nr:response regulator [Stellaceae bacterium]